MRAPRGGPRAGFLLVEALSALALSALLIAALLSFTGLLRRSADRTAFRVETMEVSVRTVWTIANEIRQTARLRWAPEERARQEAAQASRGQQGGQPQQGQQGANPRQGSGEDDDGPIPNRGGRPATADQQQQQPQTQDRQPERTFVFSGGPDRLMFALTPEQANGLRSAVLVVYQIDAEGAVLRAEGEIRPDAKEAGAVALGPVLRVEPGPERLRFAYVDKDASGDETILDAWTDARRMPAAVRIDRSDPATGAPLGSLRVPLLLTAEPGCADAERGFCSRVERAAKPDGAAPEGGQPQDGANGGDTPRFNDGGPR